MNGRELTTAPTWGSGATAVTVIDLGVLERRAADEFDHLDFAEPDGTTNPRPSPWLVVLLLLAVCTIGLTSADEPPTPAQLLIAAPGVLDQPRLADGRVLTHVDGPDGPAVTAFGLVDGAVQWRYRSRRTAIVPAGPVVLLAPTSCQSPENFATQALDAARGEPRWRRGGSPVWLVAGAPVVVFKQPLRSCLEATIGFDASPAADFRWSGIDLDSGDVRWSLEVPLTATLSAGVDGSGRASWMAVTNNGAITAYDLRTGAVAGHLAPGAEPATPPLVRRLGAGDNLLLVERGRGWLSVSAYAVPQLSERWRTVIPAERGLSRLELDSITARWCGPSLCLGPPSETVGIDPATGAERWRIPGRPLRIGSRYALFVRVPVAPGPTLFTVYNLQTGEQRLALPGSELLGRPDAAVLLTTPAGRSARLWRLELGTGAAQAMTTLPRRYSECDASGRYLACRGTEGMLHVWRLPLRCAMSACGAVPPAAGEGRRGW